MCGVVVLAGMMLSSCAGVPARPADSAEAPPASSPSVPDQLYRETGTAAWRGKEMQGRTAASGEVFDMDGLSAAHRTLPFGTIVRVTNLDNLKSVKVKISDRGPFTKARVLDLSYGAARELGFVAQGTARVRIETNDAVRGAASYSVMAAVFTEEENARLLKERLNRMFEVVTILPFETNVARVWRVRVGSYSSEERAEQIAKRLMLEGLEPVVVRKD